MLMCNHALVNVLSAISAITVGNKDSILTFLFSDETHHSSAVKQLSRLKKQFSILD